MKFVEIPPSISTPEYIVKERHGKKRTPEYRAWQNLRLRCFNPNAKCWKNYGGRGITVCDRWKYSFTLFLKDVGLRPSSEHSLDRIDNSKGYEPGNVKWSTRREQQGNRRNVSSYGSGIKIKDNGKFVVSVYKTVGSIEEARILNQKLYTLLEDYENHRS